MHRSGLQARWRACRIRLSDHFKTVRERDTYWMMGFDVSWLNRILFPLLLLFILLNFADVCLTLFAIRIGPPFFELNRVAANLFGLGFVGFLIALALKYSLMLPMAYGTFASDRTASELQVRIYKLSVLVALASGNLFYAFVITNNTLNLLAFLM